ncbi:MAG TPA: hypothetical protein VL551_09930 [Actinospica sp.]|jgi:hypothetical protein|nr:hypothetical protein [Actinospica sp.]
MAVRFTPGHVLGFEVPGTGRVAYALMLDTRAEFAFYEGGTAVSEEDGRAALEREPLFIVGVYRMAYSKGRWGTMLFKVPTEQLPAIPPMFRQDQLNPQNLFIDDHLGNSRRATPEEIKGLEPNAVWAAEHVESRIADHWRGVPNAFVESMKYKPVTQKSD